MIEVLQSSHEVETATQALSASGLPTHITVQKNWDQWLLAEMLRSHNPNTAKILDLGCGDCCTLDFLVALGFEDLHGIDLTIKPKGDRAYQLYQGDLTATPFSDCFFDVAVSISVIEHGVNLSAFFKEAYRLLKPGGSLFVTTDYWQEKVPVETTVQPFGLTWTIFSQAEIENAIDLATSQGFILTQSQTIPACTETTVSWYEKNYTFIALAFTKQIA